MFGIDDLIGAVAAPLLGGLMGSQGSSQSTQQSIDPRMAKYIYGEDGKGGLLSEAQKWYENNKTGLNPQMLQGLNTQWAVLNDPANMGAYTQMRNLGSGLMSAPVMGNPFSDGRASLSGGLGNMSDPRARMAGMSLAGMVPQGGQTGGFDPRQSMGGAQGGMQGGNGGGSAGEGFLTLDQLSPGMRYLMSLGPINSDGSVNVQGENGLGMQLYQKEMQARMGQPMMQSTQQPIQGGLLGSGKANSYPSYSNPGMGQAYAPQAPFVQPEWVTKPQAAAPAPAVSPVDAERLRQQEEAAAMARRY